MPKETVCQGQRCTNNQVPSSVMRAKISHEPKDVYQVSLATGDGDTAGAGGIQWAMTLGHECDWNEPLTCMGTPSEISCRCTETSSVRHFQKPRPADAAAAGTCGAALEGRRHASLGISVRTKCKFALHGVECLCGLHAQQ